MSSLLEQPLPSSDSSTDAPGATERHDPPRAGEQRPRDADDPADHGDLRVGRRRPGGLAPGAGAFIGAWLVGVAIARLTGAAAVVLLLVVTAVALAASMLSGWVRLRSIGTIDVTTPTLVTTDDVFDLRIRHDDDAPSRSPLYATVRAAASDAVTRVELGHRGDTMTAEFTMHRAGTVTRLDATIETNGTAGLLWWKRTVRVPIRLHVAPASSAPTLDVDERASTDDGSSTDGRGRPIGDIDGIRPWRQGESDQAIHWPSTIRSGSIVARARRSAVETRWTIPLDSDPARLRWTLEQGLRHGHEVYVELPDGDTVEVRDGDDAARWSTLAADRRPATATACERVSIWKRNWSLSGYRSEDELVDPVPRWWTAAAAAIALNMLLGALDATMITRVAATLGIAVGAALAVRLRAQTPPAWLRVTIMAIAIGALARIAVQASGIGGLIEALRGPMPDLLMLLLVLHGAESLSRRSVRVHLAITGVVVAYAAGLRIDDRVGWWMLAWGIAALVSLATLSARTSPTRERVDARTSRRRAGRGIAWFALSTMVAFGLASLVPIPDGPASLGLPAVSNSEALPDAGALAGPEGNTPPPSNGVTDAPNRGALGEVAGYPGFSETLDTSVRGDLGDEIVMRVRAPEPAFWRGQTFTEFDGRTWRITGADGPTVEGPQISVEPTLGDLARRGTPTEEFVQTFHVESDLPNVVFAASRPETIVFDGNINTRPDGALRADRTLTAGTIYTVVSQRVQVTPEMLRAQGDLAERFDELTDNRSDELLTAFLTIPDSTTQRTIDLAEQLRVDGSTYDTILAYERWLSTNTEYDINAPVPADGADAVDDYLFESRRGFCEQIASSLVVMLRSQGVPARLATGYIPGERDQVSGVWKVRASDAHAWVEVWFPETGWQAFDPTASVPLAGDTEASTVGNDVADAVIAGITSRPVEIALAALLVGLALGAVRGLAELRRRRERGPWGLLHDRFAALAPEARTARDVADDVSHRVDEAASSVDDPPRAVDPHAVGEMLDRVAFDPTFTPSDDDQRVTARSIRDLERQLRRSR
ncbi:transglutaminaseTgpA domain-containing protein [Ilumatobacter coccineus]|uniref:Transglutaminase-like domain-containing protein n=1 Tax=Ilumatobacter coccineus (strain NBRC 103263 / KCTC 29153 / YM16-304) TaxID=1313172 RepID=A0A6C7E7M0_ILUCY|nr:transglutaminaseTgpA domain-containing protein [Ilumatobacter coccineus]BAN03664.1 hypothetical protein YM304_33500 [Ilumatobacter coccineus YM16-304]